MKPNLAYHMPPFPRTAHLPYKPNCTEDDLLATHEEVAPIFIGNDICIEEKVDGSNLGLILWDDHPVVRSKTHFLNKGFLGKTPAKNQYRSVWNWFHDHIDQFKILSDQFNTPPAVYGEWMYMSHGIRYDNLPNLFIAFDIYDGHKFIDFDESRLLLQECGFSVPPLLHQGSIDNYNQLETLCNGYSEWILTGDRRREGIYIRQGENRYKMVRADFERGKYFDKTDTGSKIIRNKIKK